MVVAPDLLCAEPAARVDVAALRQALVFAFAAGGAQDAFDEAIARASLPPSSWARANFARDLYLDELVERCLGVRIAGKGHRACTRYLARVVGEPPRDRRDLEVRRAVLSELTASPALRAELEAVYVSIARLRGLLCTPRQLSPRVRRMEILRAARESFELLAASFCGAASALARAREFGRAVVAGPAYGRLVALLDHDDHLGSLDLNVRV